MTLENPEKTFHMENGLKRPNLFDESYDMLLASIMLYGVMDLRKLARKGLLENNAGTQQQLLDLPISAYDIVKLVSQNRDTLYEQLGEDAIELYLSAFDNLADNAPDASFEVELDPQYLYPCDRKRQHFLTKRQMLTRLVMWKI